MEAWSNFIANVGFPIACTCALAFALWNMWKTISITCKELTSTNAELVKTNSNLVSSINNKIDKLDTKIDKIVEEFK